MKNKKNAEKGELSKKNKCSLHNTNNFDSNFNNDINNFGNNC